MTDELKLHPGACTCPACCPGKWAMNAAMRPTPPADAELDALEKRLRRCAENAQLEFNERYPVGTVLAAADAIRSLRAQVAKLQSPCDRSHPHENMNAICVERTTSARLANEAVHRRAELTAALARMRELEELLRDCARHFKTLREAKVFVWPHHPLNPEKRIEAALAPASAGKS